MASDREVAVTCPLPSADNQKVMLAHGGGGRLMHRLLGSVILPALRNDILAEGHDCAVLPLPASPSARLAFTTDSYVVRPLFFPGGDIGTLAVNGTVNDLAMGGAKPIWLSAGLILEEGLPWETLRRVCESLGRAAAAAGVSIVTGDTKVVERGKGDGIFINTAGIGIVAHATSLSPRQVRPGDAILLSGDVGRHGIALMAVREGMRLETALESDCAPLARTVLRLLDAELPIHCLRDLTRGGLVSALVEIAEASGHAIQIQEDMIPVHATVRAVCEILGLDPLHVANEGRFVAFLPPDHAERALDLLRREPLGAGPQRIGTVEAGPPGRVILRSSFGTQRILDMLSGEQLRAHLLKDSMHEASIMQNAFDLAFAQLPREAGARIVRLRLRVGALGGVVPEALAFAFEALKSDTPAAEAELEIECAPACLACRACQREFEPETFPAACPGCGNWAAEVRRGQELDLVQVEFTREE